MNILKEVKKIEQEIINWRRDLHKIPELNLTLPKTSQYVQERLKEMKERTGTDTEFKMENNIDRLTSNAVPRNLERVPRNLVFNMEINFKVLSIDNKNEIEKMIKEGLKLVEIEGLGGSVSRGSGQIKFENLKIENLFNGQEENIDLDDIKLGD